MENKTTIYLVRHGLTEANTKGLMMGWNDEVLNNTGLRQAEKVAARLERFPISTVYSSPLKRAWMTAEIIAKSHKLIPIALPDIMEINYGDWQGLTRAEVRRRWPDLSERSREYNHAFVFPGGESFREVGERAIKAFTNLINKERGKQVVLVSHQGIMKPMVGYVLGAPTITLPRIEMGNASITTVTIVEGGMHLVTLNDMAHLEMVSYAQSDS